MVVTVFLRNFYNSVLKSCRILYLFQAQDINGLVILKQLCQIYVSWNDCLFNL